MGVGSDTRRTTERTDGDGERGDASQLTPGRRLGRYYLLEPIGQGAMGAVYAAYDPSLERRVALKVLHPDPRRSSRFGDRLMREARAMAQLSHPNVVTVHEAAADGPHLFLSMEYVDGTTLRPWLMAKVRSWQEVVGVFREIALGLAAAHEAGLTHRDVKPANILIGTDGRVAITDFGIALAASKTTGTTKSFDSGDGKVSGGDERELLMLVSASGEADPESEIGPEPEPGPRLVTGTPAYMSPEQHEGLPLGPASDQFSFAVVFFEALYGTRPFAGGSGVELRESIRRGRIVPIPSDADVPSWVRQIVLRGLEVDPDRRWPSVGAIAEQIDAHMMPRRGARWTWVAAAVPVAIGIGMLVAPEPIDAAARCEEQMEQDGQLWGPADRDAVSVAVERTGRAFSSDAARAVVDLIDDYVEQWRSAKLDACRNHAEGLESDTLYDRRQACLQARERSVASLVALLREADVQTARRAVDAVVSLPPISDCDASRLVDDTSWTLPDDPERRKQHQSVLSLLADTEALYRAGRFVEGLELATEAVTVARPLDPALLVRALLDRERQADRLDDADLALECLDEAWGLSLRTGNVTGAVRAGIRQITAIGFDRRRIEAAELRIADVRSLMARLQTTSPEVAADLEPALLRAEGVVMLRANQHERAIALLEEAVHKVRLRPATQGLAIANYLNSLASANFAEHNHAEALEGYTKALELKQASLGRDHPDVALMHNNIGLLLKNMGNLDAGREHLERAQRGLLDFWGERSHPDVRMVELNLASVYHRLGRAADAVELFDHTITRPVPEAQRILPTVRRMYDYATDLRTVGRRDDARDVLIEASALARALGDDANGERIATALEQLRGG